MSSINIELGVEEIYRIELSFPITVIFILSYEQDYFIPYPTLKLELCPADF